MKRVLLLSVFLLLSACTAAPTAAPTIVVLPPTSAPTAAFTAIPTFTPAPAPTSIFQFGNDGKTVAYDFTSHLCEANWMTGSQKNLPCPGDLDNPSPGYVGLLSGSDQGLAADFPMILMNPITGGLFGRFPSFTVGSNEEFRTTFTCRSGYRCEMEFTLGYYDSRGKYQEPFPINYYRFGVEPPINYIQPLGSLSGQTVDFVLVVRPMYQSDPAQAWGLWLSPRILR
jgi:hypothetical protein